MFFVSLQITKMAQAIILLMLLISTAAASTHVHNAVETEMFSIPISPNLFNWTYQGLFHLLPGNCFHKKH